MIFYIFGDFQHIKPLVESDIAHSVRCCRGPTIIFVFLMFPLSKFQVSTPFSPLSFRHNVHIQDFVGGEESPPD